MPTPIATRRAILGAAAAPLALPAIAGAAPSEDSQFLAWEREARFWWDKAGEPGIGDDATEALVDRYSEFEALILETPSEGLTAARIKAEIILGYGNDFIGDSSRIPAMKAVVTALRRIA
jgi:hypothetical protein